MAPFLEKEKTPSVICKLLQTNYYRTGNYRTGNYRTGGNYRRTGGKYCRRTGKTVETTAGEPAETTLRTVCYTTNRRKLLPAEVCQISFLPA